MLAPPGLFSKPPKYQKPSWGAHTSPICSLSTVKIRWLSVHVIPNKWKPSAKLCPVPWRFLKKNSSNKESISDSYNCAICQWQIMEACIACRWAVQISDALIWAEWFQNRDKSLIIVNQMKWVSLNSEHNSSTGTRASELTFPNGSSTSYCDPDLGPSAKWNPSKCYPHFVHCHLHKCHFPYFPWCLSHQIWASHHTPSLLVTSTWL